jgi:hypothetical protein
VACDRRYRLGSYSCAHQTVGDGSSQTFPPRIGEKGTGGPPVIVVIVALLLEIAEDRLWIRIRPIREQHYVLAVKLDRALISRLDDDRDSS